MIFFNIETVVNMSVFAIAFVFSFAFYLFLSVGSGDIGFWAGEELVFAVLFAGLAGLLSKKLFSALDAKPGLEFLSPKRILFFAGYVIGPLFFEMAKANLDVAYRVITGKIRPGIVKISSCLNTEFGMVMLANSITLTPGTLTVEMKGKDLYVHWINVKNKNPKADEVCGCFCNCIRRITE